MTESAQKQQSSGHRIFATSFASIYPHYVAKAVRKGHTAAEVDEVIAWLTGYDAVSYTHLDVYKRQDPHRVRHPRPARQLSEGGLQPPTDPRRGLGLSLIHI